ncbi:PPA1309 family protein [Rhodococcus sp. CH91]|uniref:PPA1309 family protein n=1 Tax=Rhodococcus sp. CH91 TaxID=2910256 RepID=UPI001F4A3C96|nr:PPA1309 family protein [Rhodococcus sp. CH91]
MSQRLPVPSERALARAVHEIIDFADAEGWDRPPVMFALVPTVLLAAAEPTLADQLDEGHEYTPIAQDDFPEDVEGGSPALDEFLATTTWPDSVAGCALVQEVVILPPTAENELDDAFAPLLADAHAADEAARHAAHSHPERRAARLISAVLRDGPSLSLLQLRPLDDDDPFAGAELRSYDNLAPHVVAALYATLEAGDDD